MAVGDGFVDDCDEKMLEIGKSRVGVDLFLMAFLHSLEVYLVGGMWEVGRWSWIDGIVPFCAKC